MFILKSKDQLEKAITKAKKMHTSVKFIAFGVYSVKGTKGNFYLVKCEKVGNEKQVSCQCEGGRKNLVCFHAVSALSLHIGIARQRQESALR